MLSRYREHEARPNACSRIRMPSAAFALSDWPAVAPMQGISPIANEQRHCSALPLTRYFQPLVAHYRSRITFTLMLARPYCRSRILALTCSCLGLVLLLKLTANHYVFNAGREELLQHVSNSTLGVRPDLCLHNLLNSNHPAVPKDLCAWIGIANRSSRLNVLSRRVHWSGCRIC